MEFDFIAIVPLLLSHCGFFFVFGCGVSFLVSSSVFLSMIFQQLVVILVFLQEGVRARPSTPPSWFPSLLWVFNHFNFSRLKYLYLTFTFPFCSLNHFVIVILEKLHFFGKISQGCSHTTPRTCEYVGLHGKEE